MCGICLVCVGFSFKATNKVMHTAKHKGPVVGRPISANPRLNFNLCFFIPLLKSLFGIIFCVLLKASNSHILDERNLSEFSCKGFRSEISFTLIMGYLNSALNNLAKIWYFSIPHRSTPLVNQAIPWITDDQVPS